MEDRDYARVWTGATYGPFAAFENLNSLNVDQAFLDLLPDFPKSLERFYLQNCYASVYQTMSHIASKVNEGAIPLLRQIYLSTDVLAPGKMLDLPSRGATDVLFEESCDSLQSLFAGTAVCIGFEDNMLSQVTDDYSFAFELDRSRLSWPLISLK
jgi:hypothetical protein